MESLKKNPSFYDLGQLNAHSESSMECNMKFQRAFMHINAIDHEDDYGFYDDVDEDATDSETSSQLSPSDAGGSSRYSSFESSSISTSSKYSSGHDISIASSLMLIQKELSSPFNLQSRIIFQLPFTAAKLFIRSFTCPSTGNVETVQTSLRGFRIIQTDAGENAEFKVYVKLNDNVEFCTWKRFSDFARLYDEIENEIYDDEMECSRCSWSKVIEIKSWFRDLSVVYLIRKSYRLESFLYSFFFDLKSPHLLLRFLAGLE